MSRLTISNLVTTAFSYSKQWNFEYNLTKSLVLVWGKDTEPIKLGAGHLQLVPGSMHVGVPLCCTRKAESQAVTARISETRRLSYALQSFSSTRNGPSPITGSKLYNAICKPKLLYGVEVWDVPPEGLDTMENFHDEVGRRLQGLPDHTSRPACHATLGWLSVEACIDLLRLMFLWKLLQLPVDCVYNKLARDRLTDLRFSLSELVQKTGVHLKRVLFE